jgi:hypothetical protein
MSTGQPNVRTTAFKKQLARLPSHIREAAEGAFEQFLENPNAPALANQLLTDTKKGRHRAGSHAVTVTIRYRAIYVPDGPTNVWYWIGSHEEYNNFVGKI